MTHRNARRRTLTTLLTATLVALVGLLNVGVAPASATVHRFATNTGTSSGGGYLWTNQGPDWHDASTQNGAGMKWKLQYTMAGIYNAESRTSNAVAAVNALNPGIAQQWAGTTTNTAVPTCAYCASAEDAWLIRIVPNSSFVTVCGSDPNTLGCAQNHTSSNDGGVNFNVTSCLIFIDGDKYKTQSQAWDGVWRHEMGHCFGLAHNSSTYLGVQQLMYPVVSQNNYQQGDANGIRALTAKV